jgi:P27 family predicted phage terminase small subunit
MRGRKPKPVALRLLEGNPGKRPLPNEPKPEPTAPPCPYWLPLLAKREWRRLAPRLELLGLLTEIDQAAFAGYCCLVSRWRQAEALIEKEGMVCTAPDGRQKSHPATRVAFQSLQLLLKFAGDFGLTPSSRSRINVLAPARKSREQLEEEKFFGRDPA